MRKRFPDPTLRGSSADWKRAAIVLLLAACAGSPPQPEPLYQVTSRGVVRSAAVVSLEVEARDRMTGQTRLVAPQEDLRSGDQISMRVQVEQPAYVYVVQVAPGERPTVLYPTGSEQLALPGSPLALPAPGSWFEVDDKAGADRVYVIASVQPLGKAAPTLCAALGLPCGPAQPDALASPTPQPASPQPAPPPRPPRPPPELTDVDRRVPGAKRRVLRASTDGSGIAVLRFDYRQPH